MQLNLYAAMLDNLKPDALVNSYAAGAKETARDLRARDLDLDGKTFLGPKPYLAFYLHGYWYVDPDTGKALPADHPGLMDLIRSGKADFFAADTYTMFGVSPSNYETALALVPLPHARIIYSRYFPQYQRIITLYACGQAGPPTPASSLEQHLAAAQGYFQDQALPFALREAEAALAIDPCNPAARALSQQVLAIYR